MIQHLTVSTRRIYGWRPKLVATLDDIKHNRLSYSLGTPAVVSRLDTPRGGFFIIDGHHRVMELILAGHRNINVVIDTELPRIERTGGAHANILSQKQNVYEFLTGRAA